MGYRGTVFVGEGDPKGLLGCASRGAVDLQELLRALIAQPGSFVDGFVDADEDEDQEEDQDPDVDASGCPGSDAKYLSRGLGVLI